MSDISIVNLIFCSLLGIFCPDSLMLPHINETTVLRDCRHAKSERNITLAYEEQRGRHFASWGALFFTDDSAAIKNKSAKPAIFWRDGNKRQWASLVLTHETAREWHFFRFDTKSQRVTRATLSAVTPQRYAEDQAAISEVPAQYRKASKDETIARASLPSALTSAIPASWRWYLTVEDERNCAEQLSIEQYKKTYERDLSLIDDF